MGSRLTRSAAFARVPERRFFVLAAVTAACGLIVLGASAALALNGQFPDVRDLSPAGITIDGSRADWDTYPPTFSVVENDTLDRMGPLYEGGLVTSSPPTSPAPFTQTIVGDVYARYDCVSHTLFVRVHGKDSQTGNELLLRMGAGNEFVVAGHVVGDVAGSEGAFAYIAPGTVAGWEASFGPLAPGTYSFTARAVVVINGDFRAAVYGDSQQVRVGATCSSATPSPTPAASPTPSPTGSPGTTASSSASPSASSLAPSPSTSATAAPTGSVLPTAVVSPSASGTGGVAGASATPRATLPPTSTAVPLEGGGISSALPVLAGLAGLVATLLVGLPVRTRRSSSARRHR